MEAKCSEYEVECSSLQWGIRLSTTVVTDWSILVFFSYRIETKPAIKIQYILSPFFVIHVILCKIAQVDLDLLQGCSSKSDTVMI